MSTIEQIKSFVSAKINRILSTPADSAARASLARLRRGIGHRPGELPDLWGEFLLELPEEFHGHGAETSRAEWAVYTSLTLFALHQQGKDRKGAPMHRDGISLGAAANQLMKTEEDRERVSRRFYPVATAADMIELTNHLRGLISLLRASDIPLDYGRLAADLWLFQSPEFADSVKLRWGEDFCRMKYETNNTEE